MFPNFEALFSESQQQQPQEEKKKVDKFPSNAPVNYRQILVVNEKLGPSLLQDVLDPYHTAWKEMGLDSDDEVLEWDVKTREYFLQQFGIDFSNATYIPQYDGWQLQLSPTSSVLLIPYKLMGTTYRVREDTLNPWRANTGTWYVNGFGNIAIFTGSGTFSSGVAAGTNWGNQDIISYNLWQFRMDGDLWKINPLFRERITARTPYPVLQPVGSQGIRGQLFHEVNEDEDGNPGTAWLCAQTQKDYVTGQLFTVTTNYIRFPGYQLP